MPNIVHYFITQNRPKLHNYPASSQATKLISLDHETSHKEGNEHVLYVDDEEALATLGN